MVTIITYEIIKKRGTVADMSREEPGDREGSGKKQSRLTACKRHAAKDNRRR
jgi:hypothetical protein